METVSGESSLPKLCVFDRSPEDRMHYVQWYFLEFLEGVRGLKPDQIGIYSVILPLIYASMGMLRDDDRYIAGHCQCDVRTYKKIKDQLIALGKISVRDGYICNDRAIKEIARFCASAKLKRAAALEREAKKRGARSSGAQHARDVRTPCAHLAQGADTACGANPEIANDNNGRATTALPPPSTQIEIEIESTPLPPKRGRSASTVEVEACRLAFEAYNTVAKANALPRASKLTDDRVKAIGKILEEFGFEGWLQALNNIPRSPHLIGDNDTNWKCHLEFLTNPKKFIRVHDGGYLGRRPASNGKDGQGSSSGRSKIDAIMGGSWQ